MQEFEGTKIIISSSQISEQMAINEIYKLEPNSKVIMWFESGLLLVRVNETFESISKKIIDNNTVFIRHIFPVLEEVDINGTKDDLTTFKDVCEKMKYLLDKGKSFSVQIRLTKGCSNAYAVSDINLTVANLFTQKGFINDVRNPDQVISILIANNKAYIGISYAFQNLSSWPGGIHRFAFEEGQISRAEFKLLEAIELFKIRLPYNGQALDLGASPGGWTKILRKNGLIVTAVDPALLHSTFQTDNGVFHYRLTAQEYFKICQSKYDLIVNDMRMDCYESAHIMLSAAEFIKKDGLAIMTLKLPSKGIQSLTNKTIVILQRKYNIKAARQLYHNRKEVTLVLTLKS